VIKWFATNKLVLNLDITCVMKYKTRIHHICIGYKGKYIEDIENTIFFGLHIDNHLNLKNHIEQMIPKLNGECCAVRSIVHIDNINTLKSVYYPDQQMHKMYILTIFYKP
jgi:hypothetical protein